MLGRLFGWVNCLRGRHQRNENKVRRQGEHYVSRCRYCGRAMWRREKRDWLPGRPPAAD